MAIDLVVERIGVEQHIYYRFYSKRGSVVTGLAEVNWRRLSIPDISYAIWNSLHEVFESAEITFHHGKWFLTMSDKDRALLELMAHRK